MNTDTCKMAHNESAFIQNSVWLNSEEHNNLLFGLIMTNGKYSN